ILRGVRQQQDEPGRFSICSRQAAVVLLLRLRYPLYCKQDIFIFYIQWLIFLLIGNTMKNTMLRKGLTIF
ncbi:hypothetical protein OFN26_23460, partial [Escherichia coli]|nr:hypothetical protein [Escherichia coli]